jgi:hypothetical protein
MLATAACARDNISNISTAAIDVSKLIYKGKVKAFAEKLWCEQHEPDVGGTVGSAATTGRSTTAVVNMAC